MLHNILVNYLVPLLIYGAITGIANLLLSKKSQVELWAEANPRLAAVMKLLRAVGLDPWQIISAISLWATKKLPDAQRSEGLKEADPKIPKPPSTPSGMGPMGGMLALCLCLSLASCAIFGSGGSFWPKVEKCAPIPASLVRQVADILVAGGDYEAALKQLALQDGGAAVICAVQAFVSSIASKVGAAPDELSGEARGKAFLAQHPVGQ